MTPALAPSWSAVLLAVLAAALLLAFVRLLRGPTLADRVVALDLMSTAAVATIAVAAIVYAEQVLLDVAMLLALVGFVATVAFAHALRGRSDRG